MNESDVATYAQLVKASGITRVFIEERNRYQKTLDRSVQYELYRTIRPFVREFIPVYPHLDGHFDQAFIATLEYHYSMKICRVLVKRPGDYIFLVGGGHLALDPGDESPIEYALRLMGVDVRCTCQNLLKAFPEGHDRDIGLRKGIIAEMIRRSLAGARKNNE